MNVINTISFVAVVIKVVKLIFCLNTYHLYMLQHISCTIALKKMSLVEISLPEINFIPQIYRYKDTSWMYR